jgi:transcription elongation factor Elf1
MPNLLRAISKPRRLYYVENFTPNREYLCPSCNKGIVSLITTNYDRDVWKENAEEKLICNKCETEYYEDELHILLDIEFGI